MSATTSPSASTRLITGLVSLAALTALVAGCSSTRNSSGAATTAASTTSTASTTTAAPTTTAAASTTASPTTATSTTMTATSAAPTTTHAPSTTIAPAGACAGAGGIPSGAAVSTTIHGDIDGDLLPDTVTEYSLSGQPHVHARLASGRQSDTALPIGNADHVTISFENFDYSLGAATKPPVAVLAVGATKAGTAVFSFLTLTPQYCIRAWHTSAGQLFVGRISHEPIYQGLMCETAMGHRYYSLTTATPAGSGFDVSQQVFRHNFTTVVLDPPLAAQHVAASADIPHLYGDFAGCDHAPLFP